jgi:hypothetical protein
MVVPPDGRPCADLATSARRTDTQRPADKLRRMSFAGRFSSDPPGQASPRRGLRARLIAAKESNVKSRIHTNLRPAADLALQARNIE